MLGATILFGSFIGCLGINVWIGFEHGWNHRWWRVAGAAACVLGLSFGIVAGPFELRKAIALCLMPVGLIWVGLSLIVISARSWASRRMVLAMWIAWSAFSLGGNVLVARIAVATLENPWSRVDPFSHGTFDAVLVLGGGVARHHHGQTYVGASGDRIVLGARLYREGVTSVLVTTGPVLPVGERPFRTVPELTQKLWEELGVPVEAILPIDGPRATKEEVSEFAEMARASGWQRVAIVSSAVHLRRVERHCRRFNLEAKLLPANFLGTRKPVRPRDLIPQSDGFRGLESVWWEILGILAGR